MRQHGHANEETTVILTAVGIQSPSDAPTRSRQRRNDRHSHRSGNPEPFRCANTVTPTKKRPSFSPQWESRALPMRQHGHANEETTVILTAVGIQSPSDAPTRSWQRRNDRNSHRSGNPEPFRCANTVTPTKKRPSFSPQWESRALPMRQHGHGNEDSTRQRAGLPTWTIPQDTHQVR